MSEQSARGKTSTGKSWINKVLGLSILLVLAGGAVGGYWFGWPMVQAFEAEQKRTMDSIEELAEADAALLETTSSLVDERLSKRTTELKNAFRLDVQKLSAEFEALRRVEARATEKLRRADELLAEMSAVDQSAWREAEAKLNVRMASQRLIFAQDVRGALALLGEADALLVDLSAPKFDRLRAVIASDQARLRALPKVDTVGLMARLAAVEVQIQMLDWVSTSPTAFRNTAPDEQGDRDLGSIWDDALAVLSSYFVVTPIASPDARPLGAEGSVMARSTLMLQIEQARIALLTRDAASFSSALTRASSFINNHTYAEDARRSSVLTELAQLSKANLLPELPSLESRQTIEDERQVTGGAEPESVDLISTAPDGDLL